MSEAPFITVVMPVRNEASFIGDTLGQLLRQEYPDDRFEIIVADGMSDDATREIVAEIARAHPQVRLLDNPKRLSSAGRNVGFKNGKGDYFLVVDGHCYIPVRDLFKNVVNCFGGSGADCLGRPQPLDPPGLTPFQQAVALARGSRLGHGGDSLIYSDYEGYCSPVSTGAAYRREVFEKVGYVDEGFDACEDVEFNYRVERAGLKCYMSPHLKIHYFPRKTLGGLFRQLSRYGRGRYLFMRKHAGAMSLNQLVPAIFVGGMLLSLLIGILALSFGYWPQVFLALMTPHFTYAGLVFAQSLHIAAVHGYRYFTWLPIIFLTIHGGLGIGFINGFLKTKDC
jgi:succinoglycan biosynthesis protein ExoA